MPDKNGLKKAKSQKKKQKKITPSFKWKELIK